MRTTLLAVAAASTIGVSAAAEPSFSVTSPDISEGQQLASDFVLDGFGCMGDNISPALAWENAPAGTKSFVVTAYDPDAPTGSGWWHWVVFNIPAEVTSLARGAGSSGGELPQGAIQSRTDFGAPGFGGACPPPGEVHRYQFTVHALGVEKLDLDETATGALVGFMTTANSLASKRITAVFSR